MEENTIKYISLDNLNLYDTLLRGKLDEGDAKSLKTVGLSSDKKSLLFWKVTEPIGSTPPAYSIELPEPDLSNVILKVPSATDGNIGSFANGTIVDSGISANDLATKLEVDKAIATAISQSGHLSKEIVTVLPSAASAKSNVIYMIKDESITDGDAYEEWMLLGGELVPIGSTRVDIDNYYTKEQASGLIATAKTEAINEAKNAAATDASTKAEKALVDSKKYTDTKTQANADKITVNENNILSLNTTAQSHTTILSSHDERIKALENGVPDLATATEEDILAMFKGN